MSIAGTRAASRLIRAPHSAPLGVRIAMSRLNEESVARPLSWLANIFNVAICILKACSDRTISVFLRDQKILQIMSSQASVQRQTLVIQRLSSACSHHFDIE